MPTALTPLALTTAVQRACVCTLSLLVFGKTAVAQTPTIASDSSTRQPVAAADTRFTPLFTTTPQRQANTSTLLAGPYAAAAQVGQIKVKVSGAGAPADGKSRVPVTVQVLDRRGDPLMTPVLVTVEVKGARMESRIDATQRSDASVLDADPSVPGIQLLSGDGVAAFVVVAPSHASDVEMRMTAGPAQASGSIRFGPSLDQFMAAGLIEGIINVTQRDYQSTLSPVRMNDGFEQEFGQWSQRSGDGNSVLAARASVYLQGKIRGDALLTLAYDSDKETRARLLSGTRPDEYYPVYGDASIKGFDTQSSSKLYVRVGKNQSFVLYGDFATGAGYTQATNHSVIAGNDLRQLGAYNRALTGVQLHVEDKQRSVTAYASQDTLKNFTEEMRANGTSGPFALTNGTELENSERVEIVVRDRDAYTRILSVTPLTRLVDYIFEPFSGRILLTRPLHSQDPQGNPVSLRVSYEADEGGVPFWLLGVDAQVNLSQRVTVGGSLIEDQNPAAPYALASVNAGIKLTEHDSLVVEAALSHGHEEQLALPTSTALSLSDVPAGTAQRLEYVHKGETNSGAVYVKRIEDQFYNPSAGQIAGTVQMGAELQSKRSEQLTLETQAIRQLDLDSDANLSMVRLSGTYAATPKTTWNAGLRRIDEHGVFTGLTQGLGCNPKAGSYFGPGATGGVGNGMNTTLLNVNQSSLCVPAPTSPTSDDLAATTAELGVTHKATDRLTVNAQLSVGESNQSEQLASQVQAGLRYQVAERTHLFARAETERGLASPYSINTSAQSSALVAGIDSAYMAGGNLFSEFRQQDSADRREEQLASGVRNVWHPSADLALSTGLEHLAILSGQGQNATAATVGADYTGFKNWRLDGRLEWRRLDGGSATVNTPSGAVSRQETWLSTVSAAHRLNQDWSAMVRNYYLATVNTGPVPNGWQDRVQVGLAYRPMDNNRWDVLSKLEYQTETNINGLDEYRHAWVGAVQTNFHPSRPWWWSARLAAKRVEEQFPNSEGGAHSTYSAWLLGGRVIYDIGDDWDVGVLGSVMRGMGEGANGWQSAYGLELGRRLGKNLWLSAGYNWSGFTDNDLSSDYTAEGVYLRLRFKFGPELFANSRLFGRGTEP